MLRPWLWTISLLLVLVPGFAALDGGEARPFSEFATSAEVVADAPAAFPHGKHVSYLWMKSSVPEVARDCRGCHDFDPSDGYTSVSDSCKSCHYDFPDGKESIAVTGTYDDRDGEDETFQHTDHLNLDCRACHGPKDATPSVPDNMLVPEGLGWCVNCHDPKGKNPAPEAISAKGQVEFQKKINAAPRMRKNGDAVFKHSQHMPKSAINDPKQCQRCHQSMERSAVDIGSELFDPKSCGSCHQDAASEALIFGLAARQFESGSDRSFYHSDHLGAGALEKSGEIKARSCLACHEELKTEGRGISDYPLKKDWDHYDACAKCHEDSGLKRDGRDVAWKISDHADAKRMQDCGGCHLLGVEKPMKDARAERESKRSHPTIFDLQVQKHPHIVGPQDSKPQDCGNCHISQLETSPSRIVRKEFSHASHISKVPDAAQCIDCHKMPKAGAPAIMEMDNGQGRRLSYDEASCASCHLGVTKVAPLDWKISNEKLLLFDHGDHVKLGDPKSLDCGKCHLPTPSEGKDYSYAEGVKDCSACHDHGNHPDTTGKADRGYVDGCAACHEKHVPGLPPQDVKLYANRGDIQSIEGAQHHPVPRDRSCADCHLPALTPALQDARPSANLKSETVNYSPKTQFHSQNLRGGPTPGYCFACHFHNPGLLKRDEVTLAIIDGQQKDVRRESYTKTLNVTDIRKALGGQMKGYPGLQR